MISHKYKCIFIHIPKCAGSSIERALGHADNAPNIPDHRSIRMLQQPALSWASVSEWDNLRHLALRIRHAALPNPNPLNTLTLSRRQYGDYFKFTIVRNPWARAFSWYGAWIRDPGNRKGLRLQGDVSFGEFLREHAGKGALRTQLSWLRDFEGRVPIDFVGRFETLEQDFETLCTRLQIPHSPLPHARKGGGDDYRLHYDDESKKTIASAYSEEIEQFGYSFE
jgi:hypothetical protein